MCSGKMHFLGVVLLFSIFMLSSCYEQEKPVLRLATAANAQQLIKDLASIFEEQSGVSCDVISGSSGKLAAQISAGAPYQLFFAADLDYPKHLYEQGLAATEPEVYARGQLILWAADSAQACDLNNLTNNSLQLIALANPKHAPYGRAALECLTNLGLLEAVQDRLIYAESVGQTNQFIVSKTVAVGFTARSAVAHSHYQSFGRWKAVDPSLYTPIDQGMVLLRSDPAMEKLARDFIAFIKSKEAAPVFERYGYLRTP